jgi:hypothetical protein
MNNEKVKMNHQIHVNKDVQIEVASSGSLLARIISISYRKINIKKINRLEEPTSNNGNMYAST